MVQKKIGSYEVNIFRGGQPALKALANHNRLPFQTAEGRDGFAGNDRFYIQQVNTDRPFFQLRPNVGRRQA